MLSALPRAPGTRAPGHGGEQGPAILGLSVDLRGDHVQVRKDKGYEADGTGWGEPGGQQAQVGQCPEL